MANVSVYDPFSRWNRVFSTLMSRPDLFEEKDSIDIRLDVTENEKAYTVRADVPGVNKDDIKVDIDGNHVSITAEVKKAKEEKKGETVVYSERYEGTAFRGFTLDREVDAGAASAKYADGVLELTLPKKANGASKRVTVS